MGAAAVTPIGHATEREAEAVARRAVGRLPQGLPHTSEGPLLDERASAGPIPAPLRTAMESAIGADFGDVRVHGDARAQALCREHGARALTHGQDIYLSRRAAGLRDREAHHLLAHELAHTEQQRGLASPIIARDAEQIAATDILPFAQGDRVVMGEAMEERWASIIESLQPEIGQILDLLNGKILEVRTATADLVEAVATESIQVPAIGQEPAYTLSDVTLRLARASDGSFELSVAGTRDGTTTQTLLRQQNLSARRDGSRVILSAGGQDLYAFDVGEGRAGLAAYTAPHTEEAPEWLRDRLPSQLDVLSLRRLPPVREGTAEEQRAVESVLRQVRSSRAGIRQRLTFGLGFQATDEASLLLAGAWEYSFRPVPIAGSMFQVPLEIQLRYAPSEELVGSLMTGAVGSLEQIGVPVNLRIMGGLGVGRLETEAEEMQGTFGPMIGVGLGYDRDWFRVELRYDHLWNVLSNDAPNVDLTTINFVFGL